MEEVDLDGKAIATDFKEIPNDGVANRNACLAQCKNQDDEADCQEACNCKWDCIEEPGDGILYDICLSDSNNSVNFCGDECIQRCRGTYNGYVVNVDVDTYLNGNKIKDCAIDGVQAACTEAEAFWETKDYECTASSVDKTFTCSCIDQFCGTGEYQCEFPDLPCPSEQPSMMPTMSPSATPTATPSTSPTSTPSASPTTTPSTSPTSTPSTTPTVSPTGFPTASPSFTPTSSPTEGSCDDICDVCTSDSIDPDVSGVYCCFGFGFKSNGICKTLQTIDIGTKQLCCKGKQSCKGMTISGSEGVVNRIQCDGDQSCKSTDFEGVSTAKVCCIGDTSCDSATEIDIRFDFL